MRETVNERLVREAAGEVALEAMRRIRARLREAEASPGVIHFYESEWVTDAGAWPAKPMPAWQWIPHLREDLSRATAEFESCRRY